MTTEGPIGTISGKVSQAVATVNIATALHVVYQKVGYVQKQRPKAGSGLNYSYASENALIEHLRPALVEAGIVVFVAETAVEMRETYTNKQGTVMNRTCVKATVRFTHAPSGTYIDVQAPGEGTDAGDKSTPKAITGAYKYALRQTFCIETGDDPDQAPSVQQERNGEKPAPRPVPQPAAYKGNWSKLWLTAKEKGLNKEDVHGYFGLAESDSLADLAEERAAEAGVSLQHEIDALTDALRART